MSPSVGERFLDDPIKEEARHLGRFCRKFVRDLETRGSAELRPSIEVRTDRCDEALVVQDARVQFEHHVSKSRDRVGDDRLEPDEPILGLDLGVVLRG